MSYARSTATDIVYLSLGNTWVSFVFTVVEDSVFSLTLPWLALLVAPNSYFLVVSFCFSYTAPAEYGADEAPLWGFLLEVFFETLS